MSDKLHEMLSSFREDNAEKTYMEFYQYCTKTDFSSAGAQDVLAMLMAWLEEQHGAIAQSFGLLMLGGLIDSGKLDPQDVAPKIADLFVRTAKAVDDFRVLDSQHHFVHFISHFAYLAGSFCEQFKAACAECEAVAASLLDLYLRASEPYWCAEELLVARVMLEAQLSREASNQLFSKLKPVATPQDADNWDATAAMQWQALRVVEHHKRQLVMALNVVNAEIDGDAAVAIEPLVRAHYESMFGA
jgi:hypothetical protein